MPRLKLTPEFTSALCAELRASATPIKYLVEAAGIDETTFWKWMRRGETARSGPYRVLFESVRQARAEGTKSAITAMRGLGLAAKDWRQLAWELERTRPREFGLKVKVSTEENLREAFARLKEAFADDPENLIKAVSALAGEHRAAGADEPSGDEGGSDTEGGEAVHAAPTKPDPEGVPGA